MSRNGSGTYSLPSGNPVVAGTAISDTWANNTLSDIATALTGSLAKDGQTTPTANLPMGGYHHTNVSAATARTQYCTAAQAQDNELDWLTSVSGADTITATAAISMAAYKAGQTFRFVSDGANTGAVTLNINSIGAKSVTKRGTTALAAGEIPASAAVEVVYDGTQFQLINVAPLAVSGSITTSGYTQSTARLLGRTTASTGAVEEISVGTGLTLSGGSLSLSATSGITLKTPVASTSGTSIDFTSIPAGTKRITINFSGVSTNGSDPYLVQIGDAGGFEASGYLGASNDSTGANYTAGFGIKVANASAVVHGSMVLTLLDAATFTWSAFGVFSRSDNTTVITTAGSKSLSEELNSVRITTTGGSNTFDAGKINIAHE